MNTKSKYLFLFVLLVSILTACGAPAPAPTVVPTVTPTVIPAPTTTPFTAAAEPIIVVQGYYDALNAKNVNAAMALVAEGVQISGGPDGVSIKAGLMAFTSSEAENGVTFEITDLKVVSGDTATFNMQVYENGALLATDMGEFQVQDGMIIVMKFTN